MIKGEFRSPRNQCVGRGAAGLGVKFFIYLSVFLSLAVHVVVSFSKPEAGVEF